MSTAPLSENPACNLACRACHYKDLDYPAQLARKQRWAERQLGGYGSALRKILPAPEGERLGYRAKSWLRSHFVEGDLSFGMFRAVKGEDKWGKEFISWNTCPLHSGEISLAIARLREELVKHVPAYAAESLFGVWFGVPHAVLICKKEPPDEIRRIDWKRILEPPLRHFWFHQTNQVGKSVFGEGPILPLSADASSVDAPIRAFRQISKALLDEARTQAVAALLKDSPSLVVDLYCGTGEIAKRLPAGAEWLGIESSKEAAAFSGAYLGLVEDRLRDRRVLDRIRGKYAFYINPPRPGLGDLGRELVVDLIRERRPTSIVYLSCSASSLARDLKAFESVGVRVESLQPFDFFPQTEHFETLAVLST